MNLKFKLKLWLYKKVEPAFLKLKTVVQIELNRLQRLQAIEKGTELWKKYRKDKPLAGSPEDAALVHSLRDYSKRTNCCHTKGGRYEITSFRKDYAVYLHRFPDDSERIKCMLCPKAWYPNDSDWNDALKMVQSSTNTASSSQVVLSEKPVSSKVIAVYHDDLLYKDKLNGPDIFSQELSGRLVCSPDSEKKVSGSRNSRTKPRGKRRSKSACSTS